MRKTSDNLGRGAVGPRPKITGWLGALAMMDADRSPLLASFMIVLLGAMIAAAVAMAVI